MKRPEEKKRREFGWPNPLATIAAILLLVLFKEAESGRTEILKEQPHILIYCVRYLEFPLLRFQIPISTLVDENISLAVPQGISLREAVV